jgi:hypothetical protein
LESAAVLRDKQDEKTASHPNLGATQLRLCDCGRYRRLARGGKAANVVTAAIARELAGFVWAIARHVPPARAELNKPVIALRGGASEPPDTLLLGKSEGAATVSRTLATTICRVDDLTQISRPRQPRDTSMVMQLVLVSTAQIGATLTPAQSAAWLRDHDHRNR